MYRRLVMIPVYNEALHITAVLERLVESLDGQADIVVVDDGSTDETGVLAQRCGARVVQNAVNVGYGRALQVGYRIAYDENYDSLVQLDGDGQHDPRYVMDMFHALETRQVDVVIGNRFADVSLGGTYHAGLWRKVGMTFFAALVALLVKQRLSDPTSGFRAFRRRVFPLLLDPAYPRKYPDADALVMMIRNGVSVCEMAVPMYTKDERKSIHHGIGPVIYAFSMTYLTLRAAMRPPVTFDATE